MADLGDMAGTAAAPSAEDPATVTDVTANTLAASAPSRSMRERKQRGPLLEGGGPLPAGKGKPVPRRKAATKSKTTRVKGATTAASTGNKKAAATSSASASAPAPAPLSTAIHGAFVQGSLEGDLPMLELPEDHPDAAAEAALAELQQDAIMDEFLVDDLHDSQLQEDYDEDAVFCICNGKDDGTPMLGCEGCENW